MKITKISSNEWLVWNEDNEAVKIVKVNDTRTFGSGKFYRVDGPKGTIKSLIRNFQTAKSKAYNYLKGGQ